MPVSLAPVVASAATTQTVDYDLSPAATPRPVACELTVSRRCVRQPRPFESDEWELSVTVTPDPAFSAAANLDRVHELVVDRLTAYSDGR